MPILTRIRITVIPTLMDTLMRIRIVTPTMDIPMVGFTSAEAGAVGAAMATDIEGTMAAMDMATAADLLVAVDSTAAVGTVVATAADIGN
jgi:hypothetical protein